MTTLLAVVQTVEDYGTTHDEEQPVVPLAMRMVDPPSSRPPAWKTKKWMWCRYSGTDRDGCGLERLVILLHPGFFQTRKYRTIGSSPCE